MGRDFARRPTVNGVGVALSSELGGGGPHDHTSITPIATDAHAEATPITSYPDGVTVMTITATAAWDGINHTDGTVLTVRSGNHGWQRYVFDDETAGFRDWHGPGWSSDPSFVPEWGVWYAYRYLGDPVLALAFFTEGYASKGPESYGFGTSVANIPDVPGRGFPGGQGEGVLVTTRSFDQYTELDYATQLYQRADTNDLYFRSWAEGATAWGAWSKVSLDGHNHDDRYYTETESDSRFVNETDHTKAAHDALGIAPGAHAPSHTNGTDDIQSASATQKGLATAAQIAKLDGIETGATADQTAAEILAATKTVDGPGSGLDADLLDGNEASAFVGTGDARLPTTGENDALQGTSGVPSNTNRYVTNLDSRLSDARTPTAHDHDSRYYTETESNNLLAAKADLVGGVVPTSQLPALAINDTFTVASQAAMLALTAQRGDMAIRTDFDPDRTYILSADDPTVLANWVRVTFGDVVSVNGQTGVIVLAAADVGASPTGHTHDDRYFTETESDARFKAIGYVPGWTEITGKPATFPPTIGSGAADAVAGNDARLTNARTPTAHAATHQPGGSDAMAVDAAAATGSLRTLGTGAQQAAAGNDGRLSDARTPTSHAASHSSGGTDAITHNNLAGLTTGDPHTQYQKVSEKDQNSGYVGKDASGGAAVNFVELARFAAGSTPATPGTSAARLYTVNVDGFTVLEGKTETGGRFRFLRDQLLIGRNNTGATIPAGSWVRVVGWDATNEVMTIALADTGSDATMPAVGLVTAAIANGASGRVWQIGLTTGLNTAGMTVGGEIYLTTNGGWTQTRPTAVGGRRQFLGTVLTADATTGQVFVFPEAGYETIPATAPTAATQAQVDAETDDTTFVTPLRQAAASLSHRQFDVGAAAVTAQGDTRYDSSRKIMLFHDGVRERAQNNVGFMPFAYPVGGGPSQVTTTALALAANGGTALIPLVLEGSMLLHQIAFWNTDAATARGPVEFALYEERLGNANAIDLVSGAVGTLASWTPSAAAIRLVPVTTAPVYLAPGTYWLAIKNNSAAQTLGLGVTAAGTMARNVFQTKTLTTAAFGATLDAVAATWTKVATIPGARLEGRVFGQATAF